MAGKTPRSSPPGGDELLEDQYVGKSGEGKSYHHQKRILTPTACTPKGKTVFPRSKASELQEALNHVTYFKELLAAQESALKRLDVNRQICAKNLKVCTARIEKLQEAMNQ